METYPTKEHIGEWIGKEMDDIYNKEKRIDTLITMLDKKLEVEEETKPLPL